MSRTPLTVMVALLSVTLGLYAAWIQCGNFEFAGHLDALAKDSQWIERCITEQESQLARLTYRAELELSEEEEHNGEGETEKVQVPDA